MGNGFLKSMARLCGCALKISLATRWSNGLSALNSLNLKRCSAKEKAERTRTTNISTCCPTFNAEAGSITRAGQSGHDHIVLFLRSLRLDWLLHHFPASNLESKSRLWKQLHLATGHRISPPLENHLYRR